MSPTEHEQEVLRLYRKQLDLLNRQLLHLLELRGTVVLEVLRLKHGQRLPMHDPQREEVMLTDLCQRATGPFTPGQVEQVFSVIFAASRALCSLVTQGDEHKPPHS